MLGLNANTSGTWLLQINKWSETRYVVISFHLSSRIPQREQTCKLRSIATFVMLSDSTLGGTSTAKISPWLTFGDGCTYNALQYKNALFAILKYDEYKNTYRYIRTGTPVHNPSTYGSASFLSHEKPTHLVPKYKELKIRALLPTNTPPCPPRATPSCEFWA